MWLKLANIEIGKLSDPIFIHTPSQCNNALMRNRSVSLDLLRILACFLVIMYHWSGHGGFNAILFEKLESESLFNFIKFPSEIGFVGVDIFFILSGAVIAKLALRATPTQFIVSRLVRIYPVYFFACVLALLISPFASFKEDRGSYLWSLSGLHFWIGGESIIETSWTLFFEINFYLIVFAGLWIRYRSGKKLVTSDLLALTYLWLFLTIFFGKLNYEFLNLILIRDYGAYFILGISLAQFSNINENKKWIPVITLSFLLSWKELLARLNAFSNLSLHVYLAFLILLLTSVVILIGTRENIDAKLRFSNKFTYTLSLMTYPIYLLHETVGLSLVYLINKQFNHLAIAYVSVFIFICTLSFLSVRFYEPFIKSRVLK